MMQRPQERETKQEDRAELLAEGVHLPPSFSPFLSFQLSSGNCLSVLPSCRRLIHTCAQMYTHTHATESTHTLTKR